MQQVLLASGAGALAWRRLRQGDGARSPAGFELQQAYRLHAIEALLHERQLARVLGRLHAAGVEPLLGRGWAAARHYTEAGLRPYRNFDLYVGAAQSQAARAALEREQAAVVLNVGCAELNDRPWSLLNERAQSVPLGGGRVRVLGVEDHLRLLALQMFRRGACRPLWLCDLAAIVESAGDFDWDHFLGGDRRRTDWVCCALVLARELVGADLGSAPPPVSARVLPQWLREHGAAPVGGAAGGGCAPDRRGGLAVPGPAGSPARPAGALAQRDRGHHRRRRAVQRDPAPAVPARGVRLPHRPPDPAPSRPAAALIAARRSPLTSPGGRA